MYKSTKMKHNLHLLTTRLLMSLFVLFASTVVWAKQTTVTLSGNATDGWYINMPANGSATTVDNAAVQSL